MRVVAALILGAFGVFMMMYGYIGFMFAEDSTNVSSARTGAVFNGILGIAAAGLAIYVLFSGPDKK